MSGPSHSPAPWTVNSSGGARTIVARDRSVVAVVCGDGSAAPFDVGNGALMAAAPDHALLLRAMRNGKVRWEPFNLNTRFVLESRGELCIGGLRYSTALDEFGCPVLTGHIREALAKSEQDGGAPEDGPVETGTGV